MYKPSFNSIGMIQQKEVSNLSNEKLYKLLQKTGLNYGPYSSTLREIYESKLIKFLEASNLPQDAELDSILENFKNQANVKKTDGSSKYSSFNKSNPYQTYSYESNSSYIGYIKVVDRPMEQKTYLHNRRCIVKLDPKLGLKDQMNNQTVNTSITNQPRHLNSMDVSPPLVNSQLNDANKTSQAQPKLLEEESIFNEHDWVIMNNSIYWMAIVLATIIVFYCLKSIF